MEQTVTTMMAYYSSYPSSGWAMIVSIDQILQHTEEKGPTYHEYPGSTP